MYQIPVRARAPELTQPTIDLKVFQDTLVKVTTNFTAIILEPRKHRALSFVVRNILTNLDSRWSVIIYHGTANSEWVQQVLKTDLAELSGRISLQNLGVENLTSKDYSRVLTTRTFIENIPTETFLMFQTDSMINPAHKDLWLKFLEYDYVGAPWPWDWLKVGNGGFSLRKRSTALAIIDQFGPYMGQYEDHFYSQGCEKIGAKKPSPEMAREFSIEQIYHPFSFGIHKAWIHQPTREEDLCKQCEGLKTLIELQVVD